MNPLHVPARHALEVGLAQRLRHEFRGAGMQPTTAASLAAVACDYLSAANVLNQLTEFVTQLHAQRLPNGVGDGQ